MKPGIKYDPCFRPALTPIELRTQTDKNDMKNYRKKENLKDKNNVIFLMFLCTLPALV